jgi:chemotaxis protein MotB
MTRIISFCLLTLTLFSCVSKKKFKQLQSSSAASLEQALNENKKCQEMLDRSNAKLKDLENTLRNKDSELNLCQSNLKNATTNETELRDQLKFMKENNTQLLGRLSDLSVVNKAGAESIKKSLEAMEEQGKYIKELNSSIQRKDSLNLALVTNLKKSLNNINDEDVSIEVKKGVVFISLSDKLLFQSASYNLNKSAESVLAKIAKVLNDHKEMEILVEGHTDNIPMKFGMISDNWDLSVLRSTSVVRYLQTKHGIAPQRMTAGGRSEYLPKKSNDSVEGKAVNRRTEIIITPKLDQFFELFDDKKN